MIRRLRCWLFGCRYPVYLKLPSGMGGWVYQHNVSRHPRCERCYGRRP